MKWLAQMAGLLMISIAFIDVYLTVLYARSGTGLLAPVYNQAVWGLFRNLARLFHHRRDTILSYSGPTLLITLSAAWAALFIFGFALMIWPALGTGIQASKGATPTDFASALYYSGYSFTTLGTGDLVPRTGFYRLLMVLKAALGFSFFTLIITYILSIYGALRQRNGFALTLQHKTNATADARTFILHTASGGNLNEALDQLSNMNEKISSLNEMHQFYPILHYFRFKKTFYALPRILMITLDSASLLKSALDPNRHRSVVRSVTVSELWDSSIHFMERLAESFLSEKDITDGKDIPDEMIQQWRTHFGELVRGLSEEGVETVPDFESGVQHYITLRKRWNPYIEAFTESMMYDAEDVMPSR